MSQLRFHLMAVAGLGLMLGCAQTGEKSGQSTAPASEPANAEAPVATRVTLAVEGMH
jgi:hypothetical protein